MTRNGHSLSLLALCAIALAVILESRSAFLAGLVLASLVAVDGVLFLLLVQASRRLRFRRRIAGGGENAVLFCGKSTEVRVETENPSRYLLLGALRDLTPPQATIEDRTERTGEFTPGETVSLTYRVRGENFATLRFTGLSFRLFSPGGFWESDRFIPLPGTLRIVPDIFGKHFLPAWRKSRNVLLRHGRHHVRRPGLGAELLSLRAYQDGDPLKKIAWRASARRDRLLTKEFENEVPVRVRIVFQPAPRLWQNRSALTAATFCARLARLVVEHRDLVEIVVPRRSHTVRTGLGLTRRHLGAVLTALGEAVSVPDPVPGPLTKEEADRSFRAALAHDPSLRRAADVLLGKRFRVRFFRHDPTVPRLLLALFLAARFDLGPGGVALLDSDPELLGFFARRMAPELGLVPSPSPETAAAWSLAESEESARRLVGVLARLSSSARDEELFVVVADLGILPPPQLETLSVELRRARAHRHRVVVFWPEVEPPSAGPLPEGISRLARNMPQFLRRLRSLGIPAGPLDPERGFQTILSQLKHLTRRQGVRSC